MKTQDEKTISLVKFSGILLGEGYWPSVSANEHEVKAVYGTTEPNANHVWYSKTDHFTQSGTEDTGIVYSCFGNLYQDDSHPVDLAEQRGFQLDVTGASADHPNGQARWSVAGAVVQDWLDFYLPVVIETE